MLFSSLDMSWKLYLSLTRQVTAADWQTTLAAAAKPSSQRGGGAALGAAAAARPLPAHFVPALLPALSGALLSLREADVPMPAAAAAAVKAAAEGQQQLAECLVRLGVALALPGELSAETDFVAAHLLPCALCIEMQARNVTIKSFHGCCMATVSALCAAKHMASCHQGFDKRTHNDVQAFLAVPASRTPARHRQRRRRSPVPAVTATQRPAGCWWPAKGRRGSRRRRARCCACSRTASCTRSACPQCLWQV